ncbi:MAG TPA: DUF4403 family protein [Gemmatimonadales bacterium]|nr:DUF4403 family protein [Gemmatimonadales bacterium]
MRVAIWMLLVLPVLASCKEAKVVAPAPSRDFSLDADSVAELPPIPPGTIVAPLTLDLDAAIKALEQEVPRRVGNIDQRLPIPGSKRRSFAFEVTRSLFKVQFAGDTVLLSAVINYKGRGWYDPPIGPDINGECGTKGPPPRARLSLRVVPRLSSDWKLKVRTQRVHVVPFTLTERDQCEVSLLHLDVTGKVMAAAENALQTVLPALERQLSRLDIRTPLEKIWVDLQQPIKVTDSLWMLLEPRGVYLGSMEGARETVGAQIGISAAPRVLSGPKPVVAAVRLPPLETIQEDQGFSMLVEGAFDFGTMSAVLTQKLKKTTVKAAGGELVVKKVTVFGVGRGRVAMGIDFSGTAKGRIWFQGTPHYDPVTGMLSVPDLDFDATSAGMLVQGVAWLKGDAIREFLRQQATVSGSELLGRIQTLAVKQMNRNLARGVTLTATIDKSEPAGMRVRPDAIVLRARATGSARLELGRELFAPKPAGN